MTPTIDALVAAIARPDDDPQRRTAEAAAEARWDTRAKPPGSLGALEAIGTRLAGIAGTCPPPVPSRPAVAVFAGDHGVVADGASAWPSDVTGLMVRGMAAGGAAINAIAATVGATVTVVDVGVAADLGDLRGGAGAEVVHAKVRPGTTSIAQGAAMSVDEARAAVEAGARVALDLLESGADLLVGGDMGIGNTTPSAALVCRLTGRPASDVVGPGAGVPAAGLARKEEIVATAAARAARLDDPLAVLAEVGGLEIAALAGLYLAAAARRVPAIVDGVIAAAALCMADALAPGTAARTLAGHVSTEPASRAALEHLGLVPVLDLGMRLGEGTGACLAVPLVQAAARALRDMADLPS